MIIPFPIWWESHKIHVPSHQSVSWSIYLLGLYPVPTCSNHFWCRDFWTGLENHRWSFLARDLLVIWHISTSPTMLSYNLKLCSQWLFWHVNDPISFVTWSPPDHQRTSKLKIRLATEISWPYPWWYLHDQPENAQKNESKCWMCLQDSWRVFIQFYTIHKG